MAYSTIDKSTAHFNTKLYTGNGSTQSITGVGFQPDWLWIKERTDASSHAVMDAVRGANKKIMTNAGDAESTETAYITSFDSDGFSIGQNNGINQNSSTNVSWNWKAGGTAPSQTYTVKVVSDSGNKYRFDDFGSSAVTLDLQEGGTYTFDQSDSSNSGHPLRFSTTSNGTHGGGSEYTTGVTTTGTPGSSGAKTVITVASGAATLYYYCTQHSGMGGQANTNSTFGSSNFSGSIQSTVSANTTAGFSIVSYTGTGANATVGHGLGVAPKMIIVKRRNGGNAWQIFHESMGNTKFLEFSSSIPQQRGTTSIQWQDTAPTSSVFSLGSESDVNGNTYQFIAYCFAEKTGYSKIASYTGNGNADGNFIYTGFKPAFFITKRITDGSEHWIMFDNKRSTSGFNGIDKNLKPSYAESEQSQDPPSMDFLSNGIKFRNTDGTFNNASKEFIYMAFGQSIVGSNNIPATAR